MEDLKWLLRKCGLLILLLLIFVIVGVICWGKMHEEEQKVAEEVWEPPVEIENSEAETEEAENAETSTESAYWFIPQASDCLISDEEKEQLQSMVLSAADSVAEIYKDIVIADAPSYSSGISEFTNEQRKTVVEQLGRSGLVSVEEDTAMQNHEAVETFYADYLDGRDSMVTVFEVHRDGLIGAVTFIYRKGELQTYYIGVRWKEGGVPEIQGTSVSNVAEQVELLTRLQNNSFGFAPENINAVKDAICLSASDAGTFYGKTGTGRVDGQDVNGWFVGLLETADNTYFFATNIGADSGATGSNATEITMSILSDMNIWK